MAGAVIGKGGHNIQKLRTEVCFDKILIVDNILFRFFLLSLQLFWVDNILPNFLILIPSPHIRSP